ncbi:MAG: hypothetical protein ACI9W2_005351, partial [Gammaproteobacteria bacterium]
EHGPERALSAERPRLRAPESGLSSCGQHALARQEQDVIQFTFPGALATSKLQLRCMSC